jgi:hypothetical protein
MTRDPRRAPPTRRVQMGGGPYGPPPSAYRDPDAVRRRRLLIFGALVAALVGGGLGALVVIAMNPGSDPGAASPTAGLATPSASPTPIGAQAPALPASATSTPSPTPMPAATVSPTVAGAGALVLEQVAEQAGNPRVEGPAAVALWQAGTADLQLHFHYTGAAPGATVQARAQREGSDGPPIDGPPATLTTPTGDSYATVPAAGTRTEGTYRFLLLSGGKAVYATVQTPPSAPDQPAHGPARQNPSPATATPATSAAAIYHEVRRAAAVAVAGRQPDL